MRKLTQIRPRGFPLRIQLTLWYTASLGLILILFAAFLYLQLRHSLLTQMDMAIQAVATQALINLEQEDERLVFHIIENNPEAVFNSRDDFAVYLLAPDGSSWDRLGSDDQVPLVTTPTTGYTTLLERNERWRVYNQMVNVDHIKGWLQVVQELEPVEKTLESLLRQMLFGVPAAVVLAGLGGFFLASRALHPIERITRTAQAINASDLHQRIGYTGPADEVGRLAATFDNMLERLQSAFERERRFTGDAAHELRTPLAALKGRIGVTLSQPRQQSIYVETLQELEEQVDRLIRLSNDLLFIARLEQEQEQEPAQQIGLSDFLGAILDQVRPLAEAKSISLVESIPADIVVEGRIDLLIRLFLNLLDNAVKYTPANGRVAIEVQKQVQSVQITVSDTGPGIAPAHLPHLFERFYRVEGDRTRRWGNNGQGGVGLGLAIAHEIVRSHGGKLSLQSQVGEGTSFVVQLPRN